MYILVECSEHCVEAASETALLCDYKTFQFCHRIIIPHMHARFVKLYVASYIGVKYP